MRLTAKFKAARAIVQKHFDGEAAKDLLTLDHETLYESLFDEGWIYHNSQGWYKLTAKEREFAGSLDSLFTVGDKASGIYRLRLMCHPDDAKDLLEEIQARLNIGEVSAPYPNRKGPGVRYYLTGKRSEWE